MAITFTCSCGKAVQVGDEFAGQEGQCPGCGRTVQIPGAGQFTEQAPPIVPRSTGITSASLPRLDAMPEPDDDIVRLMTHAGRPVEPDDDFFVDAPKEIGRLHSAFSTMKRYHAPMSASVRAFLASSAFASGFAFVVVPLLVLVGRPRSDGELLGFGSACITVGGICLALTLWWTHFHRLCSYVGAEGVAVFRCSGDRANVGPPEMFLFKDAAELRISQMRQYINGAYTGTNYVFTWSDQRGATVYRLAGRYNSESGSPAPRDPFHFALAAENAWTLHLFNDIERIQSGRDLLFFGLKGSDYIQLGPGLFILAQGSNKVELRSEQIEKMTIGDGVISVWQTGAKAGWFVNKGIQQFMYADLGNARFFLFALDKLLGIRF